MTDWMSSLMKSDFVERLVVIDQAELTVAETRAFNALPDDCGWL